VQRGGKQTRCVGRLDQKIGTLTVGRGFNGKNEDEERRSLPRGRKNKVTMNKNKKLGITVGKPTKQENQKHSSEKKGTKGNMITQGQERNINTLKPKKSKKIREERETPHTGARRWQRRGFKKIGERVSTRQKRRIGNGTVARGKRGGGAGLGWKCGDAGGGGGGGERWSGGRGKSGKGGRWRQGCALGVGGCKSGGKIFKRCGWGFSVVKARECPWVGGKKRKAGNRS